MRVTAAIARAVEKGFLLEISPLEVPRENEILVRIEPTGLKRTDPRGTRHCGGRLAQCFPFEKAWSSVSSMPTHEQDWRRRFFGGPRFAVDLPVVTKEDTPERPSSTRRLPIGAIVPWNYPVLLAIWKFAPAPLAGFTPLMMLKLAELLRSAAPTQK
jgi:hypothetical protein